MVEPREELVEQKEREEKEKAENEVKERVAKEKQEKLAAAVREEAAAKAKEEEELAEHLAKLTSPGMTDKAEMAHLTGLIKEKRSALVKQIIVKMNVEHTMGKSTIFK